MAESWSWARIWTRRNRDISLPRLRRWQFLSWWDWNEMFVRLEAESTTLPAECCDTRNTRTGQNTLSWNDLWKRNVLSSRWRMTATLQRQYCGACIRGDHTFLPAAHTQTIPAHPLQGTSGTHCTFPQRLNWPGWLVTYADKCPAPGIETDTLTHPSTNRARRRLTSLIKTQCATTMPDHHHVARLDLLYLYIVAVSGSVSTDHCLNPVLWSAAMSIFH